jgi:hypothetical protein
MPKTVIAYAKVYPDPALRQTAAINDVKSYLGIRRFNLIVDAIKQGPRFRDVRMPLYLMAGVEGYPVDALLRKYHPRYLRMFGGK